MNSRVYFNSIAHKWDELCYHDEKKIREILDASDIKEGAKILDVATGTGVLVPYLLEKKPKKIIAIDIAERMIEVAKKKCDSKCVDFKAMDVMDYGEKEFDYIFVYSSYSDFRDKDRLIRHLSNMLKEGGNLVIADSDSKDVRLSSEENSKVIDRYLDIDKYINNNDKYYISAVKK